MNPNAILALYDLEMRQDAPVYKSQVERQPGITVCYINPPAPHGAWVIYTRLDETSLDQAIQEQIGLARARSYSLEWKTYDHDTPSILRQRLKSYGFVAEDSETLMALDLDEAPALLLETIDADIRRVTDPAGIDTIREVEKAVWGHEFVNLHRQLNDELLNNPQGISLFIAYAAGEPAACAWIRYYPGKSFADLWGGSTIERFRRRGFYTTLVAIRTQEAIQRGVRFLTIDASPMSHPICEKLGFRSLINTQPYVWKPDSSK
jgi:hypothetical protein